MSSIRLDKLSHPFYRVTFYDTPTNYFSLALFGFKGEINSDIYEKELQNFKEVLKKSDPDYNPKEINYQSLFKKYKDIPEDAYLYTLSKKIIERFNYTEDLYDGLIDMVINKDVDPYSFYPFEFLGNYFNISIALYSGFDDFEEEKEPISQYYNKNSEIKVIYYFSENKKMYPIAKKLTNGDVIRQYSYLCR